MTKLSIITINYNNAEGLRKTMESVLTQKYRGFEYVVVDGASTDGSVDVIRASASQADGIDLKWVSEPDTGIYNAMNKGIKMATGEYVLMLNSGDFFVDECVVEKVIPLLDGTDIIQGNTVSVTAEMTKINRGYGKSDISFIDAMGGNFLHQASFCRLELFDRYGEFDESYKINGDTVFYAKCLAFGNASFRYIDINVAYYDVEGVSADTNGKWATIRREEDLRYIQMFSLRMQQLRKEQKKITLYEKLHEHKWSWYMTMAIAHICNWLYGRK